MEKRLYIASEAQKEYEIVRTESRQGIQLTEKEALRLDSIISPLLMRGQSLHNICINHKDEIMYEERTLYNYVDSVEGVKGGKVLLTVHFTIPQFMLAFIRDVNTSQSVVDIIDQLYLELRPDVFCDLFQVLLGDNGSEFSNPKAIEFDLQGNRRTHVFYCDPSASFQKGAAENNHKMIRRIIPKGQSLDEYTQEDINLMMNHINSYGRKNLGDKSPYEVFASLYGENILKKMGATLIQSDEVTLRPSLLKK